MLHTLFYIKIGRLSTFPGKLHKSFTNFRPGKHIKRSPMQEQLLLCPNFAAIGIAFRATGSINLLFAPGRDIIDT